MKNFGFGLFDFARLKKVYSIRFFTVWEGEYGRSALSVEKNQREITIDLCFMRFSVDL